MNEQDKHTQEPWNPRITGVAVGNLQGNIEFAIKAFSHGELDSPNRKDLINLERACACVNACIGLDNPAQAIEQAREAIAGLILARDGTFATTDTKWAQAMVKARAALALLQGKP